MGLTKLPFESTSISLHKTRITSHVTDKTFKPSRVQTGTFALQ